MGCTGSRLTAVTSRFTKPARTGVAGIYEGLDIVQLIALVLPHACPTKNTIIEYKKIDSWVGNRSQVLIFPESPNSPMSPLESPVARPVASVRQHNPVTIFHHAIPRAGFVSGC